MNTYVNEDIATVIAAVEEILAGAQPAAVPADAPLHDPLLPLPLVDDGGSNGSC